MLTGINLRRNALGFQGYKHLRLSTSFQRQHVLDPRTRIPTVLLYQLRDQRFSSVARKKYATSIGHSVPRVEGEVNDQLKHEEEEVGTTIPNEQSQGGWNGRSCANNRLEELKEEDELFDESAKSWDSTSHSINASPKSVLDSREMRNDVDNDLFFDLEERQTATIPDPLQPMPADVYDTSDSVDHILEHSDLGDLPIASTKVKVLPSTHVQDDSRIVANVEALESRQASRKPSNTATQAKPLNPSELRSNDPDSTRHYSKVSQASTPNITSMTDIESECPDELNSTLLTSGIILKDPRLRVRRTKAKFVNNRVPNPMEISKMELQEFSDTATTVDIESWAQTLRDFVAAGMWIRDRAGISKKTQWWLLAAKKNLKVMIDIRRKDGHDEVVFRMTHFRPPLGESKFSSTAEHIAALRKFIESIEKQREDVARSPRRTSYAELTSESAMKSRLSAIKIRTQTFLSEIVFLSKKKLSELERLGGKSLFKDGSSDVNHSRPAPLGSEMQSSPIDTQSSQGSNSVNDSKAESHAPVHPALVRLHRKLNLVRKRQDLLTTARKSILVRLNRDIASKSQLSLKYLPVRSNAEYQKDLKKLKEVTHERKQLSWDAQSILEQISSLPTSSDGLAQASATARAPKPSLLPGTLPYNVEYCLLTNIVESFKRSFFHYGNRKFPQVMKAQNWDYPEAINAVKLFRVADLTMFKDVFGALPQADQARLTELVLGYHRGFGALKHVRNMVSHTERVKPADLVTWFRDLWILALHFLEDKALAQTLASYRALIRVFETQLTPKNVELHNRLEKDLDDISNLYPESEDEVSSESHQARRHAIDKYGEERLKWAEICSADLVEALRKSTPPAMARIYSEQEITPNLSPGSLSPEDETATARTDSANLVTEPRYHARQRFIRIAPQTP